MVGGKASSADAFWISLRCVSAHDDKYLRLYWMASVRFRFLISSIYSCSLKLNSRALYIVLKQYLHQICFSPCSFGGCSCCHCTTASTRYMSSRQVRSRCAEMLRTAPSQLGAPVVRSWQGSLPIDGTLRAADSRSECDRDASWSTGHSLACPSSRSRIAPSNVLFACRTFWHIALLQAWCRLTRYHNRT